MSAPDSILKLVDQFHTHITSYKSSDYNETQVRREFVGSFFEALGWDVINKHGVELYGLTEEQIGIVEGKV